jgi:hypothetical protein
VVVAHCHVASTCIGVENVKFNFQKEKLILRMSARWLCHWVFQCGLIFACLRRFAGYVAFLSWPRLTAAGWPVLTMPGMYVLTSNCLADQAWHGCLDPIWRSCRSSRGAQGLTK